MLLIRELLMMTGALMPAQRTAKVNEAWNVPVSEKLRVMKITVQSSGEESGSYCVALDSFFDENGSNAIRNRVNFNG